MMSESLVNNRDELVKQVIDLNSNLVDEQEDFHRDVIKTSLKILENDITTDTLSVVPSDYNQWTDVTYEYLYSLFTQDKPERMAEDTELQGQRFELFKNSVIEVLKHNEDSTVVLKDKSTPTSHSYTKGVNFFSDLLPSESEKYVMKTQPYLDYEEEPDNQIRL